VVVFALEFTSGLAGNIMERDMKERKGDDTNQDIHSSNEDIYNEKNRFSEGQSPNKGVVLSGPTRRVEAKPHKSQRVA
jgi:hypothetical protein